MARSLDNSPSPGSPRRDAARVAPYLTHELTHHGQVTLVPPQNAGRIRKTKQKGEMSGTRRREREREEPRFNTSVPASARRARTTSARVPRAQPANPQNQLVEVRITRDSDIPEYPPPSFQEAILTPPVSPDSLAYAVNAAALAASPTLVSPLRPLEGSPIETDSPTATSSPRLQSTSHSRLTPSISPLALSAAPSPQPPDTLLPRDVNLAIEVPASPTPSHLRSSPEPPQSPVDSGLDATDADSDISSDEASTSRFMTPEPMNHWEADRRLGVPLNHRVYRERLRLEAAESTAALVNTPKPLTTEIAEDHAEEIPRRPAGKARCSQCEGLKPLDCAKANEMRHPGDDDSDEHASSIFSRRISSPLRSDISSLPCSPMVVATPVSATNPWSSTVTLSSASIASPTKHSGLLKRKESVILRKLFGAKGKEPEKPHARPAEDEPWEVVNADDFQTTPYSPRRPVLDREQSNVSSWTQVSIPSPAPSVFINRPVRPFLRSAAPQSPTMTKSSPSRDSPTGSQSSGPEPSPSEKPKSRRKPPPPPPPPPRKLRQSPSVVWKTSADAKTESSPQTPNSSSAEAAEKLPFPSATSQLSPRARAASSLTPLTVPRYRDVPSNEEAGPSTQSHVPVTPTHPIALTSESSASPPASPSTPFHHYPGRPLPQVPHEPSPLGRAADRIPTSSRTEIPTSSSTSSHMPAHNVARARQGIEYSNLTELDVLAARIQDEGARDGRNYEDLLLLAEFAGSAQKSSPTLGDASVPFVGKIEMQRRRILKDGRVKLKLTLLGTVVDRCGICLSQFKDTELAALCVSCQKGCHERCLRAWLARGGSRTCPMCRAPLDVAP